MSKECACVYFDNGKCKKFSDAEVTSWCVEGPCKDRTPSNADRIRAMSDEELAEFICGIFDDDDDDICGKFINGWFIPCYDQYSIKEWLQQPVEGA